mmetsp:Transcript_6181/g.12764  ORF Transcript_6181/g.12764 Transcript_6181/m.12764 type:complete len:327 (-) Transcript_6181:406-1386(-)
MGIILGETTNSEKSMKSSGTLVSVHGSQLGPSNGEIAIGSQSILVHKTMEWTIHWFDLVLFIFNFHLIEHIRLVKVKVPRGFPQVQVGDMRCVNDVVSILFVGLLPEVFDDCANLRSLWMPKDETPTSIFLNGKEIELLSKHTVISLLGFLQHFLVLFELCRVFPSGGVNTLQHFAVFVPTPVGTSNTLQGQSLLRDLFGRFYVRTRTQIPPFISNVVKGNRLFQSLQNFQFERFIQLLNSLFCFLSGYFLPGNWIILLDDFVHLFLDFFQVLVGEFSTFYRLSSLGIDCFRKVKIVIKSIVNPWSNCDLGFGKDLLDGHSHHMGR